MTHTNPVLNVMVQGKAVGTLTQSHGEHVFNYESSDDRAFVSLTMPVRPQSYVTRALAPIFEMHLPEGYLLAIIKKHFSKLTDTDELGLLSLLSESIWGRVHYRNQPKEASDTLTLDALRHPQSADLFQALVARFALQSPLSGVQPKVLAQIEDKASLKTASVIVKAWGDDYPELALNESLCMTAVRAAGIPVPEFYLSDDRRLFIMQRFDVLADGHTLGFEDLCVLQGKQRDHKYQGSYESVARSIKQFVSPHHRRDSLQQFYKMMLLNYWLQNGDAHLKNFAVLYEDSSNIRLAPAYDVVCTTVYVPQDVPALNMAGSKRWHLQATLLSFGVDHCELTLKEAKQCMAACIKGLALLAEQIQQIRSQPMSPPQRQLVDHLHRLVQAQLLQHVTH